MRNDINKYLICSHLRVRARYDRLKGKEHTGLQSGKKSRECTRVRDCLFVALSLHDTSHLQLHVASSRVTKHRNRKSCGSFTFHRKVRRSCKTLCVFLFCSVNMTSYWTVNCAIVELIIQTDYTRTATCAHAQSSTLFALYAGCLLYTSRCV